MNRSGVGVFLLRRQEKSFERFVAEGRDEFVPVLWESDVEGRAAAAGEREELVARCVPRDENRGLPFNHRRDRLDLVAIRRSSYGA